METEADMAYEQSKFYYLGPHNFIILDYCLIELYSSTAMRETTTGERSMWILRLREHSYADQRVN